MKRAVNSLLLCFLSSLPMTILFGQQVDSDGDGLFDLVDHPRFESTLNGLRNGNYRRQRIQDLDGARLLINIDSLSVNDNLITAIERNDFDNLLNLRRLRLGGNQISSIEAGAFDGLTGLRELSLGNNKIPSIEAGLFSRLAGLEELDLERNQLTSIEGGLFRGLTNLIDLCLVTNLIASVNVADFDGLTNLQRLNLGGNQLTNLGNSAFLGLATLQHLGVSRNQLTSIDRDDFIGLTSLRSLDLSENQISRIENGSFAGSSDLQSLDLSDNLLTELNLTRATFESLKRTELFIDWTNIISLVLDDARLSQSSFNAFVRRAGTRRNVSLVGLTFTDQPPRDFDRVLRTSLYDLTIDQELFELYAEEINSWAEIDGKSLTVVAGLCDVNRDGECNSSDVDEMTRLVAEGTESAEYRFSFIKRESPHGFNTNIGDANLDGNFNGNDLVDVFNAGQYEDKIDDNSLWATGDWNGDGEFNSSDLVFAFLDNGYDMNQGPAPANAPEPSTSILMIVVLACLSGIKRRCLQ